jgi:hypothetical protein
MIQYSLLINLINQFCLRMGTELVPETLYSNELTRLCAREDYIVLLYLMLLLLLTIHKESTIKSAIQKLYMTCSPLSLYLVQNIFEVLYKHYNPAL